MVHVQVWDQEGEDYGILYDAQWFVSGMTSNLFRPGKPWRYYPVTRVSTWVGGAVPAGSVDVQMYDAMYRNVTVHRGNTSWVGHLYGGGDLPPSVRVCDAG